MVKAVPAGDIAARPSDRIGAGFSTQKPDCGSHAGKPLQLMGEAGTGTKSSVRQSSPPPPAPPPPVDVVVPPADVVPPAPPAPPVLPPLPPALPPAPPS